MKTKKIVAYLLLALFIVLTMYFGFDRFIWSRSVVINIENIESATIYTAGENKEIATLGTESRNTIRLKDGSYIVRYKASSDYASSEVPFIVPDDGEVNIKPKLNDKKLAELLTKEKPYIEKVIRENFPNIEQYQILNGLLYDYGDWFGTGLYYIGNDEYSADMLRIILKKQGDIWKIMSPEPNLYLSNATAPGVPDDIIVQTNKIPVKIQDKFAGIDLNE